MACRGGGQGVGGWGVKFSMYDVILSVLRMRLSKISLLIFPPQFSDPESPFTPYFCKENDDCLINLSSLSFLSVWSELCHSHRNHGSTIMDWVQI